MAGPGGRVGPKESRVQLAHVLGLLSLLASLLALLGFFGVLALTRGGRSTVLAAAAGLLGLYAAMESVMDKRHVAWVLLGLAGLGMAVAVLFCRYAG